MIQPISLQMTSGHVIPGLAKCHGDNDMVPVPVELLVIDSGDLKGTVVGYLRRLHDVEPIGNKTYNWQIARRIEGSDEYQHFTTYPDLNSALHGAMAVTYRYLASYLSDLA